MKTHLDGGRLRLLALRVIDHLEVAYEVPAPALDRDGDLISVLEAWSAAAHPSADEPDFRLLREALRALATTVGVLLYEPEALDLVGHLSPDAFYEPFHGRLYEVVAKLIRASRAVAPTLIGEQFADDPAYMELGASRYLGNLIDNAPPAANAGDYARAIQDSALRRGMIGEAKALEAQAVGDRSRDALDVLLEAERIARAGGDGEALERACCRALPVEPGR